MDDDQITQLGSKMKDVYGDLADDAGKQIEGKADQVSGQLQGAYGSAKDGALQAAGTLEAQLGSFVKERPVVALLGAAGLGWMLSRLARR